MLMFWTSLACKKDLGHRFMKIWLFDISIFKKVGGKCVKMHPLFCCRHVTGYLLVINKLVVEQYANIIFRECILCSFMYGEYDTVKSSTSM